MVFAGTPEPALPALSALLASTHEVLAVVTRPPAPAGRGRRTVPSPVAAFAADHGIPVLSPRRPAEPEFLDRLRALRPDCCPVVAYGALLPRAALDVPRHGWINLHFSLLPAWRGAAPVQRALLHGDQITGATTFLIEESLDTGPVYGTVTELVRPRDTTGTLQERLARSGAALLVETLDGVAAGALRGCPQPADGASYAAKISVDEARVDWTAPAARVDRLVRACTPAPGSWSTFRDERLKLAPVVPVADGPRLPPGALLIDRHQVLVGTATTAVELGAIQPAGRREMPAEAWARGVRPVAGERLT